MSRKLQEGKFSGRILSLFYITYETRNPGLLLGWQSDSERQGGYPIRKNEDVPGQDEHAQLACNRRVSFQVCGKGYRGPCGLLIPITVKANHRRVCILNPQRAGSATTILQLSKIPCNPAVNEYSLGRLSSRITWFLRYKYHLQIT